MGFFDALDKAAGGAENINEDAARNGNSYEAAEKYLDRFEEKLLHADLETLKEMLSKRKYEVKLDRRNNYDRKRRLENRIGHLRQERWHQVEAERRAFESWYDGAGPDEIEAGYISGKYHIAHDSKGDEERKARLEERLLELREKREQESIEREEREREEKYINDVSRMRQLYTDYLEETERTVYRSSYALRDFRTETGCLTDFQGEIIGERYGKYVEELLSLGRDAFSETLSDYLWQVGRQKAIAGRSVMTLVLAAASAPENKAAAINEYLEKIEAAVADRENASLGSPAPESMTDTDIIRAGAKRGSAGCQYGLGLCFLMGSGVEKDEAAANYWFLKAAKNGNKNAQWAIGREYLTGRGGIEQNENEAAFWIEKAAGQGVPEAVKELNRMKAEDKAADKKKIQGEEALLEDERSVLLEKMKQAEHRIDYAASEREERKAIAEKQELQASIDRVDSEISRLENDIADIENEIQALLSDDPDSPEAKFEKVSALFRRYRPIEALPALLELSDAGYAKADALLYWLYSDGYSDGETYCIDDDAAMFYLKKGYETGDSICSLLYLHKTSSAQAAEYLPEVRWLAVNGDLYAEYALGSAKLSPVSGEPDYAAAVEHFRKAAEYGFYRAYSSIFSRYCYGNAPFEKDYSKCSEIAEQVIKFGCPYYMFDVAYMFTLIEDYGCTDEYEKREYYKKAAELYELLTEEGLPYAPTNLGYMYRIGKGVPADEEKAFYYYSVAAERGDVQGQSDLAFCYENGIGTDIDIDKAAKWYRLSAEKGSRSALEALERLGISDR